MFEHLDPDSPYASSPESREAVKVDGRRRLWRRRLLGGGAACLVAVLLAVGGIGLLAERQLDRIERIEVAGDVLDAIDEGGVLDVLVVGMDGRREGDGGAAPVADLIMIARLDRSTGTVRVLSVPRDLWVVADPTTTESRKINTFRIEGPEQLIKVVERELLVEIDRYVEVDFEGFSQLVDLVGGSAVHFPFPVRDVQSGLVIDSAGCAQLDGEMALALARSRRPEAFLDGVWVAADGLGDLGRMPRQHVLGASLFGAAVDLGPAEVPSLLDVATGHVVLDARFSDDELLSWARWLMGRDSAQVDFAVLGTERATVDGGMAVRLAGSQEVADATEWLAGAPSVIGDGVPSPESVSFVASCD